MDSIEGYKFRLHHAFLQGVVWLSYFIGATTLMGLGLPLLILLVPRKSRAIRLRKIIAFSFKSMTGLARLFNIIGDIKVTGFENLPTHRCFLLAANHPSFYDVILLIERLPGVNCIVNRKLLEQPFYGPFIRFTDYIPNDTERFQERIQQYIHKETTPLIIFPEGTRTLKNSCVFKRGCARFSLEHHLDVVPVIISYTQPFLIKGYPWYYSPPKAPDIYIRIMPLQQPDPKICAEHLPHPVRVRLFNQQLQTYFNEQIKRGPHA